LKNFRAAEAVVEDGLGDEPSTPPVLWAGSSLLGTATGVLLMLLLPVKAIQETKESKAGWEPLGEPPALELLVQLHPYILPRKERNLIYVDVFQVAFAN
jgi:hypothetical protein